MTQLARSVARSVVRAMRRFWGAANSVAGSVVRAMRRLWGAAKTLCAGIAKVQTLLAAVVALSAVVWGWPVTHKQNLERDRQAATREIRVQYLIEAYRRLEYATDRPVLKPEDLLDYGHDVEKALGDIQLLGTEEQAELAKGIVASMKATGEYAETITLLKALRADLRQELNLNPLEGIPARLRIFEKPQEPPAP